MNRTAFSAAIVAAGAFAAACASAGTSREEKAAERLSKYDRTGETQTCLPLSRVNAIEPLTDSLFLVRVGASEMWVNEPRGRCAGAAAAFNRLQYSTTVSQLCRNEIIQVIDNTSGMMMGSCALGSFERLERKPPAADEPSGQ